MKPTRPTRAYSLSLLSMLALAVSANLFVAPAHAERASFALLLGPAIQSEGGTNMGFELKGGYRFLPAIATSVYYWHVSSGADVSSGSNTVSSSRSLSSFGLDALYQFVGTNWLAGAKLGYIKSSTDGNASDGTSTVSLSASNSSFAVAPTIAYEYPALSFLTVGGEAAYFYSLSSSVPKALSLMLEARLRY